MIPILLACLLSPPASAAGGVTLFRGTPGAAGDVVIVDPTGAQPPSSPPALTGITLRALDFNGRTQIASLQPDRPRLRKDVPGASRVELPLEFGSLYCYSRPAATSGLVYGLFVIDASGSPRSVLELAGSGAAADQVPFIPRVAVAPSGDRILVGTKFEAGGNLLEIDLATGATLDRTSTYAPQRFAPAGTHLAGGWGVAGTATGVLRFDRSNTLDAQAVPFGAANPAWFSGEIAVSSNGLHAATIAGDAPNAAHVFAFDLTGAARQVTTQAATLSGAGYLPESLHGPYLALSDDGAWCAWRVETATSREAYLGPVPQAAPTVNEQLTSNANYTDTLDEAGWFIFRGVKFVMAVGSLSTPGVPTIENLDFYSVTPSTSAPSAILNLTQTNGFVQPPFLTDSELKPSKLFALPGTDLLLMHSEQSGGGGELVLASTTQVGTTSLLANVKDLELVEGAGSRIMLQLRRSNGPKNREVYAFAPPYTTVGAPLLIASDNTTFERAAGRADGWFAFVQVTPNKERLWRFDPLAGSLHVLTDRPLFYGPALGWAPSGELAFSVGLGGLQSIFALWPTSSPVFRLPVGVGPGFVLPGS